MKNHPARISLFLGVFLIVLAAWWQRPGPASPVLAMPAATRVAAATPADAPFAPIAPAGSHRMAGAAVQAAEPAPAFAAFDDWTRRYQTQSAAGRGAMLAEGRELAAARRAEMAKLIQADPRAALAEAVPMVVRQQLPGEIVDLLETRVAGRGELALNGVTPVAGQAARENSFRSALVDDQEYRAHVFGRRDLPGTVTKTSMHGIALDGHFAVAESPVRVLEPGELAAGRPINEVCDVSGNTTPTSADTPLNATGAPTAIEYDGAIHILCGANHLAATEARLLTREQSAIDNGAAGGPGSSGVGGRPSLAWAQGPKKLLIIRVDFSDRPGASFSEDYISNVTRSVQDFYTENSFGKTSLVFGAAVGGDSPNVTPVIRMPQPSTYYDGRMDGVDRSGLLHQDARNYAYLAGFDAAQYDRVGVVFSGLNYWWAGLGNISGPNFWINSYYDLRVVSHEIGHNYGLMHANYWQVPYPYDQPLSSAGTSVEYGDAMDVMGGGNDLNYHFSHWNKSIVQWIPDTAVTTVETSGTYRVHRLDAGGANLNLPRALKMRFDDNRDYWIGYRGNMPLGTAANGAYVLWGYNVNQQGNLLNVSRRTSNSTYDSPLPVGETFTDNVNGITIRNVAQGGSGADQWLDIEVRFQSSIRWSQTAEYIAGEQEGSARVRLVRSGDTTAAISVNYATAGGAAVDGRATGGEDYVESTGTVSWAAGDAVDKFITIPVISDSRWEAGERFTVTLSSPSGALITGNAVATVAILDAGIRDFSFQPDTPWGRVFKILVQPDGSMIVGGPFQQVYDQNFQPQTRGAIAKLSADGRVLPEFSNGAGGGDGIVRALARQPSGRIIVAGSFAFMGGESHANVARLNTDGTVDSSFSASTNAPVWAAVVQADGKVVLGGSFTSVNGVPREYVARLNADGTLDTGFNGPDFDGTEGGVVKSLALQPDGRVLAGGSFTAWDFQSYFRSGLCRLLPNGSRDVSFVVREGAYRGSDPRAYAEVKAIAVLPDGRILIGGDFNAYGSGPRGRIARLQADGSVDTSFAVTINDDVSVRCNALLPLPDGRVVFGGWFNSINGIAAKNIALVSATGALDTNMAGAGGFRGEVYDFQLLANGRIQFGSDMDNFQFSSEARTIWRMISGIGNPPGMVQLAGATVTGSEGGNVALTLTRTGGSGGAISVNYGATPGTATSADYGAAAGTVTWTDGDAAAKVVNIALVSDAVGEPAETFTVGLGVPLGGALLGDLLQATVTIQANEGPPPPNPGTWEAADIGNVGAAGGSSESAGTVTITGSGDDIWNTADAFHFRAQTLTGDGAIVVRVASAGNTHPWAKIGLMFRGDLTPGSREVMAFVTPGNNSGLQYRLEPGAASAMGQNFWSGMPVWLMLVRSGDTFGGYRSYDGNEWTPLGTINCDLPDTAYIGLAVSSHVRGTLLQATFDNVEVIGVQPPGEPPVAPTNLQASGATASTVTLTWTDNSSNETGFAIERATGNSGTFAEVATAAANATTFTDTGLAPSTTYTYRIRAKRDALYSSYSNTALITTTTTPPGGWQALDIGNVGQPGSATIADPNITVVAAGADMWGPADGFHYVYQQWSGDGEIRARVARLDNTHGWAKAGVMFREALDANSANVACVLTAGANSGLQVRATAGAETTFANGQWVNAPYWVRLNRTGNVFTSYVSADGLTWSLQTSATVPMGANIYVGVATSSHTTTARTTAAFEYVALPRTQPPPPPPPPPGDWTQTSLGAGSGSFSTPSDSSVTVNAVGADIWGNADDGLFVHKFWDGGDGVVGVQVDSLTNTHPWAKAGIMLRESLAAGSRTVFIGVTPGVGAVFQVRESTGAATTEVAHSWVPSAPCRLRLRRTGSDYEAAFSTNGGATWTILGTRTLSLPQGLYLGLGVSSHATASATAVFTNLFLPIAPPPPPDGWSQTTWGAAQGSYTKTTSNGVSSFTVNATGADIWGTADDGVFVQHDWSGAGEIRARIDSMTNTHPWAKAGLMFRFGTGASAINFFVGVTPAAGVVFQVRSSSGATTTEAAHSWGPAAPVWVRLNRNDPAGAHSITASYSTNGTNWITLGNVPDPTPGVIQAGLAVSSHSASPATVQFSGVALLPALPLPPP